MKINWGFGPPKNDDHADGDERRSRRTPSGRESGPKTKTGPASEQHSWTAGANMTTKVVVGLLWAALIAGPMALGLQLLTPARDPVIHQGGPGERMGEAAAVGEFAQRAVVAWLETPADDDDGLRQYFGGISQTRPEYPWSVRRPEIAEIVRDDNDLWSVVVSVEATEGQPEKKPAKADADGSGAAENDTDGDDENAEVSRVTSGRLYFRLPVLYVEGEMIAQALPAPVPAPSSVDQLDVVYNEDLPTDHPAYARVTNFLNAMLVHGDQAELEAYTSPGTAFRALTPVPYAAIKVTAITAAGDAMPSESPDDGERVDIQVDVIVSGSNESQLSAQYALVLQARQGRWEVAELMTSPVLAEPVPVPTPDSPSTTAAPSTSAENTSPAGSPGTGDTGSATADPETSSTGSP